MSLLYRDFFKRRQQGDYDDFVDFADDDVRAWYEDACAFITRISGEIDKLLTALPEE